MKLIFKLEHQWTLCLQRFGVTRETLSIKDHANFRRMFYAGLLQMFCLLTEEVADLPEKKQQAIYDSLIKQMGVFWETEKIVDKAELVEVPKSRSVQCSACEWRGLAADLKVLSDLSAVCPNCETAEIIF
jgi:hypothetical protein